MVEAYSIDEQNAASLVASLNNKRDRFDSPDAAGGMMKKPKTVDEMEEPVVPSSEREPARPLVDVVAVPPDEEATVEKPKEEMQPYPYFYYKDFSKDVDPDPLTPLTPPGRVPNFPAKMHSILSRPDLADIVCWMPHGRSWRVLKPREFEIKVIPTYFEHAKFSSFIRQANGWGFRRITQGRDRNSYYHELFLRGLPHLCKKMKRPGVAQKEAADPDHEPDLYKIGESHPVPDKAEDDSILLQCTLQGGPKARMPIYSGSYTSSLKNDLPLSFPESKVTPIAPTPSAAAAPETKVSAVLGSNAPSSTQKLTPKDEESLSAFQQALGAAESQFTSLNSSAGFSASSYIQMSLQAPAFAATAQLPLSFQVGNQNKLSALAAANHLAFSAPFPGLVPGFSMTNPVTAAYEASNASAQFAAGFAAAAALSQHHFKNMLGMMASPQGNSPMDGQQFPRLS